MKDAVNDRLLKRHLLGYLIFQLFVYTQVGCKEECPFYLEGYPSGAATGNKYDGYYLINYRTLACLDVPHPGTRCSNPEMPSESETETCDSGYYCQHWGKTLCDPSAIGKVMLHARDVTGSFVIERTNDYGDSWQGHYTAFFGALKGNIDDDGNFDVGRDGETCTDNYEYYHPLYTGRFSGRIDESGKLEGTYREHVFDQYSQFCYSWTKYSGQRVNI
jgi:hypothetical protein